MRVTKGWHGWREINTVTFETERISEEEIVRLLKESGTYRGKVEGD